VRFTHRPTFTLVMIPESASPELKANVERFLGG